MPLYEITLEQSYAGQQVINRWNYQSGEAPAGISGAFKALVGMGFTPDTDIEPFGEDTIAAKLQFLQVDDVIFVQAIAKNIYSVTDFYTYAFPPNTTGAQAGTDGLTPVDAFGYTSNRTRSDIRRAQKRFVGIPESLVGNLGKFTTESLATYQDLGDTMADPNVVPAGTGSMTFTPYVFGRVAYTTPSGKTAYKYYDTEAEQLDHIALITAFDFKEEVRSQTSRQYGRGS